MLEVYTCLFIYQKRLFNSYILLKSAVKVICTFIVIYKGIKYNFYVLYLIIKGPEISLYVLKRHFYRS